ncbi:hypothetical protein Y1Q_0009077 [Alligator mississippiensis]|uniref:Uncharacterized protein n=1 Tax=Alligator mississippiensis TaxID=8496 RepID=A0A151MKM2_ALLMI|nr:hypothetical protein Y1Q_0009077 [Alligator mississippiensis]
MLVGSMTSQMTAQGGGRGREATGPSQEAEAWEQCPGMADCRGRLLSLERRNQALMEKVTSLRAANANLQRMNARLKEENQVFRSTEDVLLRDNQRMKLEVQELRELQETLQDDLYVLEEQLCACSCHEGPREGSSEPSGA